jgi:hypothetical protein
MSGAQLPQSTGRQPNISMMGMNRPPEIGAQMPFVSQLSQQQFAPRQPMQMPEFRSSMPSFQQLTQGGFNPMQSIASMQRQPVQMPENPFFGGSIPMDFSAPAMPSFMQAMRPRYVAGSGNEAFLAKQAAEQAAKQQAAQMIDTSDAIRAIQSFWGIEPEPQEIVPIDLSSPIGAMQSFWAEAADPFYVPGAVPVQTYSDTPSYGGLGSVWGGGNMN